MSKPAVMMTTEHLAEIRKRADAASPGPWDRHTTGLIRAIRGEIAYPMYEPRDLTSLFIKQRRTVKAISSGLAAERRNGDFIAHARTDVPLLLDHVQALEARIGELLKVGRDRIVYEEFDSPGDTPVSCGLWCPVCKEHVNDDRVTGHAPSCPLSDRLYAVTAPKVTVKARR